MCVCCLYVVISRLKKLTEHIYSLRYNLSLSHTHTHPEDKFYLVNNAVVTHAI